MVSCDFWLAVATVTAHAEIVAAVFTVLQELSSTDESHALLAGPAELPPSRAPSSSRAPLLLSRAPSRLGGSSSTTEPGSPPPKKLTEAPRGYAWVHTYE